MSDNEKLTVRPAEAIRKTMLGHVVIVTVRLNDPFSLRPYTTFTLNESGQALSVATYATEIAALAAHDAFVRGPR
jgi:hypothetical protein